MCSSNANRIMTLLRYTDGGPDGWMQSPTGEFVRYEDHEAIVQRLTNARLTWAIACECNCPACTAFDKVIIGAGQSISQSSTEPALTMNISDERLEELYEVFAERAALPHCGVKEDIDVASALRELLERRAGNPGGNAP